MRFNLRIKFADGSERDITAGIPDMIAFEDKFNISVGKLATEQRLSHLLFLAWHAEKRTKNTNKSFEDWAETVDSVGESDVDPK